MLWRHIECFRERFFVKTEGLKQPNAGHLNYQYLLSSFHPKCFRIIIIDGIVIIYKYFSTRHKFTGFITDI